MPAKDDEKYEEMEVEDKVWCVNPIGDNNKIYVLHQAAQRWLRKDLIQVMKKNIKELDNIDMDELLEKVESEAVEVENRFLKMFNEEPEEPYRVPVFDFEIN